MGQNCCSRPREAIKSSSSLFCIPEEGTEIVEYEVEQDQTHIYRLPEVQLPAQAKYCLVAGGKLLIGGGRGRVSRKAKPTSMNEPLSAVYLFDTHDPLLLRIRSSLLSARIAHVMIAYEAFAYALSGCLSGYKATKTCERYSLAGDYWEPINPMQVPRIHAAVCQFRKKLYLTGGNTGTSLDCVHTIETYDTMLDLWTVLDMRLPISVWRHACAPYQSGIVVFGGSTPEGQHNFDCFTIALGSRRITQMAWLPHAGEFTATVLVKGQAVYTIESFTGSMLCVLKEGRWTTKCLIQI